MRMSCEMLHKPHPGGVSVRVIDRGDFRHREAATLPTTSFHHRTGLRPWAFDNSHVQGYTALRDTNDKYCHTGAPRLLLLP